MKTTTHSRKSWVSILIGVFLILALAFAALVAYRLISGKSLGIRGFLNNQIYLVSSSIKVFANRSEIQASPNGSYTNILFLHHSVGTGIIKGGLRELLSQKGYTFWDQGYIQDGLQDPEGNMLGYTYVIPRDNTDPDGLYELFTQKAYKTPVNGLSQVLQHEVVIVKSCYPNSNIADDQQIETLKSYYLGIRDTIDQHPDRFFIILTSPPLNPASTDADHAARARTIAEWLASEAYLGGRKNLAVFDLFDVLAEPDLSKPDANMLRESYREGKDSHPIKQANAVVAKNLADFIDQQVTAYRLNQQ